MSARMLTVSLLAAVALAAPGAAAPARAGAAEAAVAGDDPATLSSWFATDAPGSLSPSQALEIIYLLERGSVSELDGDAVVERPLTSAERLRAEGWLLARSDRATMRAALAEIDPAVTPHGALVIALDWLGAIGSDGDVALALQLATPAAAPGAGEAERETVPARVRLAFGRGMCSIARRFPKKHDVLRWAFERAHPGLLSALVEAMAEVPDRGALQRLTRCLGAVPQLDPFVLSKVGDVAGRVRRRSDDATRERVRFLLGSNDERARRAAMRAAGGLGDYGAIPQLIDALATEDENGVRSAQWALEAIVGLPLGSDPERWSVWYGQQIAWAGSRSPEVLMRLEKQGGATVARRLREVAGQRLFRDELAEGVLGCLERPEVDLVVLTCSILAHLGSAEITPSLVRCLEHRSAEVRGAALSALQKLTGHDGGLDPADWESWAHR